MAKKSFKSAELGRHGRCTLQIHPELKAQLHEAQLSHEHFWQTVQRLLLLGLEAHRRTHGVKDAA